MQKKGKPRPNPYIEKSKNGSQRVKTVDKQSAGPPSYKREIKKASDARVNAAVKRRKKNNTHFVILLMLSCLIIGVILSLTVFFNVNNVIIEGDTRYTKLQICTAGDVSVGDNLFLSLGQKDRKEITEKLPYIDKIEVERKLPSTLVITVNETPAFFAIYDESQYILLDGNMKVLEKTTSILGEDVILIEGVQIESSQIGKQLVFKDKTLETAATGDETTETLETETTRELIDRIISAIISEEFNGLTNIDLTDRLHVKMTYDNRLVLIFGAPTELDYKFKFALKAIEKLDDSANGYIDLTVPQNAYYTTEERN